MFVSTLLCGASKGIMKAFKAFIKPFEAQQKIKSENNNFIFTLIQLSEMHEAEGLRVKSFN